MIGLGVRLALAGGKEAIARLALIAAAVAIGTCLLLTTLAAINAFDTQNQRYAWLETGYAADAATADPPTTAVDPLWWRLRADEFRGEVVGRIDLAATGPGSPVPPGIPALPGPGQFYASPALAELLAHTPSDQLGDRYPGAMIGTIGDAALPAPDSLVIIIGHDPDELGGAEDASQVTAISTVSPTECASSCAAGVGTDANGMTVVLSVVAAALLFPVLVFIGGASRLAAARREQRFAAMRLIGATPRQITTLATIESAVASVAGVLVGFVLFALLRPLIATIPFTGDRFFTTDVSLSVADVVLVAVGIPLAAAVAARIALRRVTISPLGVTRRVTPQPPHPGRVVPLLVGVAWLGYLAAFSDIGASHNSGRQAMAYLTGVFLIMIGLVVAGPWLTQLGARITVHRTKHPAGLIAARRLHDDPRAAFRAVSGVVLAVFVGTCSIGIIATIVAYNGGSADAGDLADGTLVYQQFRVLGDSAAPPIIDDAGVEELVATAGVEGVTLVHVEPGPHAMDGPPPMVATCAQLVTTPALGRCPAGAEVATIELRYGGAVVDTDVSMADTTWPASDVTASELAALPVVSIAVGTDGTTGAVERARTVLGRLVPSTFAPQTIAEQRARSVNDIDRMRRLADVVLLASLPIAGCSLAVSVAGGLAERRRPFGLLRLTGVPLSMLRRVVTLEAAVPLLVSVVVAAGAGLAAAGLFLHAQLDETLQAPGATYYVLVAGGVAVSLAIIASTLPLLARLTGPESVRNE